MPLQYIKSENIFHVSKNKNFPQYAPKLEYWSIYCSLLRIIYLVASLITALNYGILLQDFYRK